ncbi:MAG: hypothetical protein WAN48_09015 [Actinomycetes bacterium]
MFTMLVLTESALLPHDVERLAGFHDDEPDKRIHVCVPARDDETTLGQADELVDDISRTEFKELKSDAEGSDRTPAELRARAKRHLAASVEALTAAGVTADGELVTENPVDQVVSLIAALDADELVVITAPHWLEEVLRRDWATKIYKRLRHEHREIPVLHFIAGTDTVVR